MRVGSYYVNGEKLTLSVDMGAYEQSAATNSQSMDNVTDATKENTSLLSDNISLMKDEINGLKDLNISFSDLSTDLSDFSEEIDLEEPLRGCERRTHQQYGCTQHLQQTV